VVWDRKRAEQLFNFSYRLECYTPRRSVSMAFVLPLLHQGKLVGDGQQNASQNRGSGDFRCGWKRAKVTGLERGCAIDDFAGG
jgi:uncharacterized protein YcaQ